MIIKKPPQETGATIKAKLEALIGESKLLLSALQETELLKLFSATERVTLASLSTNGGRTPYSFAYLQITPSTTGQVIREAQGILASLLIIEKSNLESIYAYTSAILAGGDLVVSIKRNGAIQSPTVTLAAGEQANRYMYSSPVAYAADDILALTFDVGAIQPGVDLYLILFFSHDNT